MDLDPKKLLISLQEKEYYPFIKNEYNETGLIIAVKDNNEMAVCILLSYKAEVNVQDSFYLTPLHWACIKNNSCLVNILLLNYADPDITDFMDKTPIDYAIHYKFYSLFEHFNDIVSMSKIRNVYIEIIKSRNFKIIEQITSYRMFKNNECMLLGSIIDKDDSYVIHRVLEIIKKRCPEIFQSTRWISKLINRCITIYSINCLPILLEYEKSINFTEYIYSGQTFLHKAVKQSNIEALEILLMYKADPCMYDTLGRLPIHYAIITKNIDIILLLGKYTFDVNKLDYYDRSFMEYVVDMKNNDVFNIFVQECRLHTLYSCLKKLCKETLSESQIKTKSEIKGLIFEHWKPLIGLFGGNISTIGQLIKSFIYQ